MAATDVPQENLEKIKKCVETAYIYFKDNNKRFRNFKNYVFKECLNAQQKGMLTTLNRPQLEFNLGAASINRKLGEFAQHEPSICVSPSEGMPVDNELIEVVEGNIRHKIADANKNNFSYEIYKDMLGGGFSCAKVWTDFQAPMSFNQDIFWGKCFDATMVGFDALARSMHKGDGQFSFEIYPVLENDFKEQFPGVEISTRSDRSYVGSFVWSYKDMHDQKVIMVCDFYEKKKKRIKIVKLADGKVMSVKEYEKLKIYWEDNQIIEQIPQIIGKPRTTIIDVIVNYKFIQDQIIKYRETDYEYLPHVFFDGNSDILSEGNNDSTYQFTKPYFYHAKGAQDLMNFTGIAIANSIDNMSMSKFIVKEEAIPQQQDYIDAITDPQRANTIVVRAYSEQNPDQPIPEPIREVTNVPLPPEVTATFNQSAAIIQAILGSTASNPENQQNYISGKAVIEAINVDNAAGMPYTVGYLAGLEQMARIHISLMPKYILGKRTIPIINKDGDKMYQDVNVRGKPNINYEPGSLLVNVEAGVNYQVEKNQALQAIIGLTQSNPKLAEFFSSEFGIPILLDNLTIYGADRLKEAAEKWMQQQKQQQQQAMQMQQQMMQQDPRYIKAQADVQKVQLESQKLQQKGQQAQFEQQIEVAKLQIEKELADAKIMEAEANVTQAQIDSGIRMEEMNSSHFNHSIDAAVKIADIQAKEHERKMDEHESVRKSVELHHRIKENDSGKAE